MLTSHSVMTAYFAFWGLLIPFIYLMSSVLVRWLSVSKAWGVTQGAAVSALALALVVFVAQFWLNPVANVLVQINPLSSTLLLLIGFLAWVILRFSSRYLSGDTRQQDFQTWFLATLAAVSLLVIANHAALFVAAWLGVSLCLHQLLIYFPERPKAVLAAHKKFLLSRVADTLLIAAVILLAWSSESLLISEMIALNAQASERSWPVLLAVMLITLAALTQCAQLPFHGWLLQVMEAPTPVSALLHAGIINIGGFLLLRFAELLSVVALAQWLLLVIGTMTAIVASLTMMTRISIKVMLAWSTCAQMGFMLMEIALGFYTLAMLHLVAHSVYKAYSFLNSGDVVDTQVKQARYQAQTSSRWWHWLVSTGLVAAGFVGLHLLFGPWGLEFYLVATVMAIGVSIYLAESLRYPIQWAHALIPLAILGILTVYLVNKVVFAWLGTSMFPSSTIILPQAIWVIGIFTLFLLLFASLRVHPNSALSRKLYPAIYAGLYLDEWFSRYLLRFSPCRQLPPVALSPSHLSLNRSTSS